MANIPLTGIPSNFRVPGAYAEIKFGQGPSTAGAPQRDIIIAMPKLSTGTWTAATRYGPLKTEEEVKTGAGAGSPLHRAYRIIAKVQPGVDVYALPVAETAGTTDVAADVDITFATDPTDVGIASVWVAGELNQYSYDSNDTVTTIAAGIKDVINGKDWLPVSATNASGVLTITAKLKGISQGDGTTGAIRVRGEISNGTGTTITVEAAALGLGTAQAGVEGTTTEAANLATALTTIDADRKYYIVHSTWDATSLTNLVTHITNKSLPKNGHRSVAVGAFTGALAAGQTLATARNFERLQIAWQPNSDHDPAEIAANVAAIRAKHESVYSAYNFNGYGSHPDDSDWLISAANAQADWPDADDQNDAINDGLAPIASSEGGSYLVMSVNTRSKTSSQDDFRATKTGKVSVGDDLVDTLLVRHALNYSKKKLRPDKLDNEGKVDGNQRLGPSVVTPSKYKAVIRQLANDFEAAEKIESAAELAASCTPAIDPQNPGRLELAFDYKWLADFDQSTFRVSETSSG